MQLSSHITEDKYRNKENESMQGSDCDGIIPVRDSFSRNESFTNVIISLHRKLFVCTVDEGNIKF